MSEVRMCDNCQELFSVNEQGWKEFQEKSNDPRDFNPHNHGMKVLHMCARCVPMPSGTGRPRIALEASYTEKPEGKTHGE